MSGLTHLKNRIRQRRLRWFGHVRRAGEKIIGRVESMKVEGRRPAGRPKKTWRNCVQEDLSALNINEQLVQDRVQWRIAIKPRPTPTDDGTRRT